MRRTLIVISLALLSIAAVAVAHLDHDSWPQWGGQNRDFQAHAVDLSADWGEDGPPVLWRRALGDGNSAISVKGRRLYTMYRRGDAEVVVAMDRKTGETLWERSWQAETWKNFFDQYGLGPHVTPLATGDRVCTAGIAAKFVCLEAGTGEVIWQRDLWQGYELDPDNGGPAQLGYTASPLLYRHMILTLGGGSGGSVIALHIDTGETVWSAGDFEPSFASPILITVGDQRQLVVFAVDRVFGLDPENGARLWEFEHKTAYKVNAATPVWDGESILFISSAYDSGSRALRITRAGEATRVEQLWASREIQVHHQTSVLIDGLIYASSGDFGPTFLTTLDPADGSLLARERGFAKANLLAVGRDILILDEDGTLALGTARPDGITIRAQAQVFETRSWTVPTLVGTTLFARDRKEVVAFDLEPSG